MTIFIQKCPMPCGFLRDGNQPKKTYKMLQFWYIFPSFPIHFLSGSDSCGSHLDLGASMTIYYHGQTFTSHGAASCALPLATSNATCNWVSKQLRKKRSSQLQIVADSCSVLASIYIYTWIWIFRQTVSYIHLYNILYTIVIHSSWMLMIHSHSLDLKRLFSANAVCPVRTAEPAIQGGKLQDMCDTSTGVHTSDEAHWGTPIPQDDSRWSEQRKSENVRECQGDWKQRMWSQRSWTPGHIQTHPDTSIHPRPPLARITWALLPAELLSCAVLRCQSLEVTRDFPSILWKDWSRIRVGQHNNNTPTCMCIV